MTWLSRLLVLSLAIVAVGAAMYPRPAVAAYVDGFDFPLDPRDGTAGRPSAYARYNVRNPYLSHEESRCYDKPMSDLQHAGEDWQGTARASVYAVADGQVVWSGTTPEFFGVLIIEHTLPVGVASPWGGNLIYSMYGHLDPSSLPRAGTEVQRGQVVARLRALKDAHLHLELRRYGNMQDAPPSVNGFPFCNTSWAGPGYTDTNAHPDWFGYTEPSSWIDAHRRIQQPDAPTIAWVAPVADEQVFRVTGGTVRLEVTAAQSAGIRDVRFQWWDAPNETFVELSVDTMPPYQAVIDVARLNMAWNQITAIATDTSGNRSSAVIWLYRLYGVYLPQAHGP